MYVGVEMSTTIRKQFGPPRDGWRENAKRLERESLRVENTQMICSALLRAMFTRSARQRVSSAAPTVTGSRRAETCPSPISFFSRFFFLPFFSAFTTPSRIFVADYLAVSDRTEPDELFDRSHSLNSLIKVTICLHS